MLVSGERIERLETLGVRLAEVAERGRADERDAADPARRQAALRNVEENARLARALSDAQARARASRQARSDALSWASRSYAEAVEKQLADTKAKQKANAMQFLPPASEPDRVRALIRFTVAEKDDGDGTVIGMAVAQTVFLAIWPILWIVWAFLTRGGLSFLIVGLALARRDGRPAMRLQCAWRAHVVWFLVTWLAIAAVWLDAWYWMSGADAGGTGWMATAAIVTWWAAMALLPLYVVLALWFPVRSMHDWLSGTYVVPR